MEDRVGRWGLGDIAEDRFTGRLWRVVGFITSPAVAFRLLDGSDGEMVQVAGCLNEMNGLRQYRRQEGD